jgi:hypothetical protein
MASITIKKGKRPEPPRKEPVRTRDLERVLHLTRTEMKHFELIARAFQLDSQWKRGGSVRRQRSEALWQLRQRLSDKRVDQFISRFDEINGTKG